MKFKLVLAASALSFSSLSAMAQVAVFTIQDIQSSAGYTDTNTAQTFNGTGFVGLYSTRANGTDAFAHLLGLEQGDYSRTALQVDISSLIGTSILSATLSYDLLNGSTSSQTVTVTSYTSTGTLGYFWAPPSNNGQVAFTSFGTSSNSVDVTALLNAAVTGGQNWFGLHLQGSTSSQWTWTWPNAADSANLRLTVNYQQQNPVGAVPEPSTYGMVGAAALLGLVVWKRSRRVTQVL